MNKIEVENFNFFYGDFQALIDLNLSIQRRKITALIGPSGCGKSTFLRSINRMNDTIAKTRAEGRILLDGKNIYDPDIDVVDLRQQVIYSPEQQQDLPPRKKHIQEEYFLEIQIMILLFAPIFQMINSILGLESEAILLQAGEKI